MAKRQFGELELTILRLFKEGERLSVKQVHKMLGGIDNYNTIMTVMYRLSQKRILERERSGAYYEYWLASSEKKQLSFFDQIKQRLFGVGMKDLISYLVESRSDISNEDLIEIEELIKNAKTKRGLE